MKITGKARAAFAAMAAICACSAGATDWPASGGTYTVPADTTVEVGAADYSAVSALGKVVFANENSVLRLTTSSFPSGVKFQGPGRVVASEKILLPAGRDVVLKRTLGDGDGNNFVKFVFEKGIDTSDGATSSKLYYYRDENNKYSVTNATMYLDGLVTNISFYADSASTVNGRMDLGENIDLKLGCGIATRIAGSIGVVRQRGGTVVATGSYLGDNTGSLTASYLLDGGSLRIANAEGRWFVYSSYTHFRQTGGTFYNPCWMRAAGANNEYSIPSDFIYSGSASAEAPFALSTPKFIGAMNVVCMDDAQVNAGSMTAKNSEGGEYVHNVVANGGTLTMNTLSVSMNVYFSFNGGTLRTLDNGFTMFGNNAEANNPVWVRIYENGGCIYNDNGNSSNNQYLHLPNIKEPEGNVVLGVGMSEELRNKAWQTPPSVEITDSTGAGSNAVAIVDYDFDSGKVTNITVACRGENYSGAAGAVTANLRYKAGDALLSTPLVCTVGPCQGGDVTFAGGKTIYADGCTNTYHGATIVDMDRDGVYDHPAEGSNLEPTYHSLFLRSKIATPRFLNSTSVVVKSGCLWRQSEGESFNTSFPACQRLEFYGGHFAGWSPSEKDVVVGGETWLVNHKFGYASYITMPADGTLTVDLACLEDGTVPALKYGTVKFNDGATIAVKNLQMLPKGGSYSTFLDLSGTTVNGTPAVVQPEGGKIRWDATAQKLLGKRLRPGLYMSLR